MCVCVAGKQITSYLGATTVNRKKDMYALLMLRCPCDMYLSVVTCPGPMAHHYLNSVHIGHYMNRATQINHQISELVSIEEGSMPTDFHQITANNDRRPSLYSQYIDQMMDELNVYIFRTIFYSRIRHKYGGDE